MISKTADCRAKRTKIWDSGYSSAHMYMCRVLFWCPIPWVWFEVIRCTLQNFRFHDFRNTTPSTVFIRFQANVTKSIIITGCYRRSLILAIYQKLKILWHIDTFVNTGSYEAGISKRFSSPVFISCQPNNCMRTLGSHGGIQAITFLANRPSYKKKCGTLKF